MNIKIAWRNIWRNKRRTLITVASIFFAVFFALIMRSFQKGSYSHMIKNVVKAYTGYIQIHRAGYTGDETVNNALFYTDSLRQKINLADNVKTLIPRLESFALASSEAQSKVAMVVGIEPEVENKMTKLEAKLLRGAYLEKNGEGVLVAEKLANYLKLDVNDTLVMLGQGYHGMSAAGKYPVRGIVHFPSPKLNNLMIYMTLRNAQNLLSLENGLSTLVVDLQNEDDLESTVEELENRLGEKYEVKSWQESLPELVQQIESDNAGGVLMLGILYIIIGFGIFGTVLMMVAERRREFGVMVAIGMHKTKLTIIVAIEMVFMAFLGLLGGAIASSPIMAYYYLNPIQLTGEMATMMEQFGIEAVMPLAFEWSVYSNQIGTVAIIVMIASAYPLFQILKLNLIRSLRS